jgi:hypothetical protein
MLQVERARVFASLATGMNGASARSRNRSYGVLDAWSAILPARIVKEEIGDYLEDIHRRAKEGQHWQIYLRVASAMFWTLINSIGYALKALGNKQGA